ncbi:MAG: hypothetical protein H0U48_00230 [Euzebyaceae bacterium]|jgi:hypothetical protein|nr:hypothetical protein [Euzebyaceae bacterium]
MRIDKQQLIERFLADGELDKAEQADQLPDQIDPAEHHEALKALGVDPGLLLTQTANLEEQPPGND